MTESFNFEAKTFASPEAEQYAGELSPQTLSDISKIRAWYPELSHWGIVALDAAWGWYSQDIYAVGWVDWLSERDSGFLAYIYIKQKSPRFKFRGTGLFADDVWKLGEAAPWLTNAELPDWCMPDRGRVEAESVAK